MKGQCKDRKESLFWWERVGGCCFQGGGVAWTTGRVTGTQGSSTVTPGLLEPGNSKMEHQKGAPGFEPGTSWSAVKCSTPELYPLLLTYWPQLTPLCFCSYIWTLPTSAVLTMGSNTHGHSRLVFVLWNPTGLPLQVGVTIDLVSLQPTPGSAAVEALWPGSAEFEALWPRKCRGWGPFGLPGETAGCPEPSHTAKLGSEPSLPR